MYGCSPRKFLLSSEQKSAVLLHHVAVVMLVLLMSVCILVSHPCYLAFSMFHLQIWKVEKPDFHARRKFRHNNYVSRFGKLCRPTVHLAEQTGISSQFIYFCLCLRPNLYWSIEDLNIISANEVISLMLSSV